MKNCRFTWFTFLLGLLRGISFDLNHNRTIKVLWRNHNTRGSKLS